MESPNNSYAPPKSTVADVASGSGEFEKAERGTRLSAVFIDFLVFTVAWVPTVVTVFKALRGSTLGAHAPAAYNAAIMSAITTSGLWMSLASLINIALLVVTAVLVHRNGQTIGKKWVGIKVVRTDGSRASLGRIFWLRNVVNALPGFLPFLGLFYPLIDALLIFGDARRCIHDYIADTIVIRA